MNRRMANRSTRLNVLNGVLAAVLVGGIVLIAVTVGHGSSASATPRSVLPTRGAVTTSVTATGNVQPAQTVSVNFKTGGTLTEVDVTVGQQVTAGQVLAKIDPTDAQTALTQAQANLTAAQDKLTQMQQVQTPVEVAQANAALVQSQTQLNSAQVSLERRQPAGGGGRGLSQQAAVNQANAQLAADKAQLAADLAAKPVNPAAVAADNADIAKDQAAVTSALNAQSQGALKDQASIHQAENCRRLGPGRAGLDPGRATR